MKREYPENKLLMSMPEKMRKVIVPKWHPIIRTPETESEIIDEELSQCEDESIKEEKDSTIISDDSNKGEENLIKDESSIDDVEDESICDAD